MLRVVEVALFLAPFVMFFVWRMLLPSGGPSRTVVMAAVGVLVLLLASLIILRGEEAEPADTTYVPSQMKDGRILPPAAQR
jgi:hypothetical protein